MLWKNKTKSIYKVPNLKKTKEQNSVYSITSLNNTRRLNLNLCADIRNESERYQKRRNYKIWTQKTQDVIFFRNWPLFKPWRRTGIQHLSNGHASQIYLPSSPPPPSRYNLIENRANRNAPAWWTETKHMDVFM